MDDKKIRVATDSELPPPSNIKIAGDEELPPPAEKKYSHLFCSTIKSAFIKRKYDNSTSAATNDNGARYSGIRSREYSIGISIGIGKWYIRIGSFYLSYAAAGDKRSGS